MNRYTAAPWVVGPGRRLAPRTALEHLDELVRLVLLTGPNERLHRPGFGGSLGASALFEPLSPDVVGTLRARARGSLVAALGDRLDVVEVTVTIAESALNAEITYRPKPAGQQRMVTLTLPGGPL